MLGPTVGLLGERTLVLNRSWLAITTTTVRRALSLVYQESAQIICPFTYETHDFDSWSTLYNGNRDRYVRTVSLKLRVPEIIVLSAYDGLPTRTVAFSRRNLYRRDNFTCQYCGKRPGASELTIDHVMPRSQGGRTTWENCVLACVECNKRKAHRSLGEADMRLLRRAHAPQWSWDVELALDRRRESWKHFLPRFSRSGFRKGNGTAGR
ncbi:MAG: HNH endonuclease [Planctomycetota bacterium]|jgi:5-methylcytosine-specific restriction endonuclease McrA